jgi:predicted nucleotidyltransferase
MIVKKKYQDLLLNIIQKHLPGSKVFLFGSQATGKATEASDIDLALDAGATIPFNTIISILAEIDETIIPMKIDLVDLNGIQESFKQAIIREGIAWKN